jgi:hypothetical protein
MVFGVVDTIMTGHSSPTDLAAMRLGASLYGSVFVRLLGVVNALNPIIAHHQRGRKRSGDRRELRAGRVARPSRGLLPARAQASGRGHGTISECWILKSSSPT